VLVGGGADGLAELCAPVERGLLVTRLWYLNPVHERSVLLTGTTRDGTFWIEDGKVAGPARDVRFTDSPLRILEATEALSSQQRLTCPAEFYGRRFATGTVSPALRAQGFRVTGESPT
jgi:predicted Zn-dependent protease